MVVQHLDKTTLKDHDTFRQSEWGPDAAAAMCNEVRHLPIPNGPRGSTLGTLLDHTPKELISKVTLEEKVFKTWYSGRSVLIGDGKETKPILSWCHSTDLFSSCHLTNPFVVVVIVIAVVVVDSHCVQPATN